MSWTSVSRSRDVEIDNGGRRFLPRRLDYPVSRAVVFAVPVRKERPSWPNFGSSSSSWYPWPSSSFRSYSSFDESPPRMESISAIWSGHRACRCSDPGPRKRIRRHVGGPNESDLGRSRAEPGRSRPRSIPSRNRVGSLVGARRSDPRNRPQQTWPRPRDAPAAARVVCQSIEAACRCRAFPTPLSSTGPISRKVTSVPSAASTTAWLTRTSPGRA